MASISAHRTDNHEPLDLRSNLLFGFSWLLVMAVGLMPLAEAVLH